LGWWGLGLVVECCAWFNLMVFWVFWRRWIMPMWRRCGIPPTTQIQNQQKKRYGYVTHTNKTTTND